MEISYEIAFCYLLIHEEYNFFEDPQLKKVR